MVSGSLSVAPRCVRERGEQESQRALGLHLQTHMGCKAAFPCEPQRPLAPPTGTGQVCLAVSQRHETPAGPGFQGQQRGQT